MFAIRDLAQSAGRFTTRNSHTILSSVGVVGVVTTAILSARGSRRAVEEINFEEALDGRKLSSREKLELTWSLYIPAVASAGLTIAAIIYSNRISSKKAVAAASALAITERAYEEYVDKIRERLGVNKERKYRDEIAQETVRNNPPSSELVTLGDSSTLCLDAYSGRYFLSSMEDLRRAQNDLNYQIIGDDSASLTDYYASVGLPSTTCSDEVGWNTDRKLELLFSTALTDGGKPCIVVTFERNPIQDPHRYR